MAKEEQPQSDEINFEPLFSSLFVALKNTMKRLGLFFKFAYQIRLRIIIGGIIGALLGIGLAYIVPPYYKVRMSVSSSYVSGFFLKQSTLSLQEMIEDKNFALLGQKLNLSEELAGNVKSIKPDYFNTINEYQDTVYSESFYFITAEVYDIEFIPDFEKGLINHLKNNPFVKNKSDSKKERYQKIVSRIEDDIQAIDSLLSKINDNIGSNNSNQTLIMGDPINPAELLAEKDRQYNVMLKYKSELDGIDDIKLIHGFDRILRPYFPKKSYFAIVGLLIGGIISMILFKRNENRIASN